VCASLLIAGLLLPGEAARATAADGADFNGDGVSDMAISGSQSVLVRYGGSGATEILRQPEGNTETFFGASLAVGDFDNDGFDELAIGDPFQDGHSGSMPAWAGAVWVYEGAADGLLDDATGEPHGRTKYQQGLAGIPGGAETDDLFGISVATGDLTGDGTDDLVVGSHGETLSSKSWAGAVTFVPGKTGTGLDTSKATALSQDTSGVAGAAETNDRFGYAVAIGDVTGDRKLDLVVGVTGENGRGAVQVFLGTGAASAYATSGSTAVAAGSVKINPSAWSVIDADYSGTDALFGSSLAVGDVTGDGIGDIVAGAPMAKVSGKHNAGAAAVLRGAAAGISSTRAQLTGQSATNVVGASETNDQWGDSVAIGDLTGDGRAEVILGAPGEAIGTKAAAGAYTVLRTTSTGVTGTGSFGVNQETANVPGGGSEARDVFGSSLAVQDLNGDGRKDVLVGSPFEDVGGVAAGAVYLLISSTTGRPSAGSAVFSGNAFSDSQGSLLYLGWSLLAGGTVPGTAVTSATSAGASGAASTSSVKSDRAELLSTRN